ncbi:hypothetical protein PAHAL_8G206600 [Panicum hallii]|uniref:Uncharacterized protein n=1 Tax=Panicum hallii TaxID=206008 RepID=A0A2T8I9K5_9POAL|nr:hypothetical protein PAHAL_8G206600 [Panicum hallii]
MDSYTPTLSSASMGFGSPTFICSSLMLLAQLCLTSFAQLGKEILAHAGLSCASRVARSLMRSRG